MRWNAALALGRIGNPIATEPLITVLKDSDSSYVKSSAADALGTIGNTIATKALITVLKDCDFDVRRNALEALTKIGNPETLAKIIQSPEINIYDFDIFTIARTLTLRFIKKPPRNKKGQSLIPVYPELIKYNPVWAYVKRLISLQSTIP